jgi:Ni/Co efflux regulator RcnB
MRKVLALLLLAGVSTPALAAGDPGDTIRSHANREARQEARAERSGGNDRKHSNNAPGGDHNNNSNNSGGPPPQPVAHVETTGGGNGGGHQAGEQRLHHGFVNRGSSGGEQPAIQPTDHSGGATDTVRNWRGPRIVEPGRVSTETRTPPTLRRQDRPLPGVFRNRVPIVSNVPHEGTQPPLRVDNRSRDRNHHWNTSWRDNHRYDWQDWRRHHRSHFHLGFYYDPFGWSYRPYQIGWRLWPNYYSSSYWINDPYDYRLPYAPPGYRWIRYWDDAILVDTFTGEVVDVINNFFW